MKLYAPEYYNSFSCIADKCRHSCCVGWEIDIDDNTLEKYLSLSHGYADKIVLSIDKEETPHFHLMSDDRCPHLNCSGLCNIILNVGEEYLCDICREHPRFYNDSCHGREVGLGMACEEACRIILSSDGYCNITEIGEVSSEPNAALFDIRPLRDKIYGILSSLEFTYAEKLKQIYGLFNVSPCDISDFRWREVISALEYLDEKHKDLFSCYSSEALVRTEHEKLLERALAYFVYRHCTEVYDEYEFRVSLGFCLFCERLLASLFATKKPTDEYDIVTLARIISEELEYSVDNTESIMLEF